MKLNPADKVERWDIEKLIPYANNSRTHSDEQVTQLAASMKEWGVTSAVLVDEEGGIIAGHGRVMAAKRLGMKDLPVMVAKGWTEAQKKAFVIADNKLAQNAGWDAALLSLEVDALKTDGFDVDLLGFSDEELEAMGPKEIVEGLTDEDDVPEIQLEATTKLGDIWLLGSHRLLCGDSTKAEDVERLMAGEKADMVFTDPPYGVSFVGVKGTMYSGGKKIGANSAEQIIGDDLRGGDLTALFREALALAVDYSKPSAAMYLFFAINRSEETLPAVSACGLTVRNWLIWDKGNVGFHAMGAQYKPNFEAFLYAVKGEPPEWSGNQSQQTIWRHSVERLGLHSTMKPVSLVGQAIMNHSPNSILDPFLGSGTTLIAAEKLNRKCYGMEISPTYCDVIVKRWQDFTGKKAVLESNGKTFEEVADG